MYFRFPIVLLFMFFCIFGLMLLRGQIRETELTKNSPPENQPVVADSSPIGGLETIRPAELKAHLEFLADDLLLGRDAGSTGSGIAANYIASNFERFELKPVGDHSTYMQTMKLEKKTILPTATLKVEIEGEMVPLRYGEDFIVIQAANAKQGLLTFDCTFAGFGIKADKYSYNDYESLDVKDRAVIVISGEPPSEDDAYFKGATKTRYSQSRSKRKAAAEYGAALAITVMRNEDLTNFGWVDMIKFFMRRSQIGLAETERQPASDIPNLLLNDKVADLLFTDEDTTYDDINNMVNNGSVSGFTMNKRIEVEIGVEKVLFDEHNVAGFLEGSDPNLKKEVIIFTAHYDHVGVGTAVAGDSIYNGAADNASGVSGLLEIAEAFARTTPKPRRSMLFLAVTAEEKGLLGSRHYVQNPIFPISETVANFNMDMIGILDTTGIVVYGSERSTLGANLEKAAEQVGLKILPDDMPEERLFYRSDHYNFAVAGIPAIFTSFGMRRELKDNMSEFYHKPSDDKNLKYLNYNYMKKHVQAIYLAALQVANAESRPQWREGEEFDKSRGNHQNKTLNERN